jgi:Lon protease-like protein
MKVARAAGDVTMREDLPPESLERLAIFPLPNCVLLPGGLLPLHVFEPRYREMTRDCLGGSRVMAIARLRNGAGSPLVIDATDEHAHHHAAHDRPAVYPHCGLGRIIASEELPDGRFHILLRGVGRVQIAEELAQERLYRQVRAVLLEDQDTRSPEAVQTGYLQLLSLCDRLALCLDKGGEQLRELVRGQTSAAETADVITAALVTDADARQQLLEALDPADRLTHAISHVGRLLCELAPCGSVPN